MSKIVLTKTDTPTPAATGKVGFFISLSGQAKLVDESGAVVPVAGEDGANGSDGADGTPIEIQNDGTNIQWRYVGDPTWTNIVLLSTLKGDQGDPGATGDTGAAGEDGTEIELQVSSEMLQWRYVGAPSWTDLFDFSSLVSPNDFTPKTGTTLSFDGPNKYGFDGTATTGNLTFSITDAKETVMIKCLHNDTTEPTLTPPGGVSLIKEGASYQADVDNILYAVCHKNNAGTVTKISYSWTQNQV